MPASASTPLPPHWSEAETLASFRCQLPKLSQAERETIVDTAIRLVRDFYVHLPQKQASHGVDPVARLRALRRRLPVMGSDAGFHAALADAFDGMLDLHTNYLLPASMADAVAFLPVVLGQHADGAKLRVVVARTADGLADMQPGEHVVSWSGVPIDRAIERAAGRTPGANGPAQRAQGLAGMTLRPLLKRPPPDEDWVDVEVQASPGAPIREVRLVWRVWKLSPRQERHAASLDVQQDAMHRATRALFQPKAAHPDRQPVPTQMPRNFEAGTLKVGRHHLAMLRIHSFLAGSADAFVAEFQRLLLALPRRGLILDVRDNGGGLVDAAERSLQMLTPRRIEPAPMQLRATPAVLALCESQTPANADRITDLSPWIESVRHALDTGAMYSAALPMTGREACNGIGQVYHGPVVLLTNALCYSATDIFAAGFQDHRIGPVLGVDACTGAGGANVWPYAVLRRALNEDATLPHGAELRVALRRSLRVGAHAGLELEERGVTPDEPHDLTRRDLLDGDQDLIAHAARLLLHRKWHALDAKLLPGAARVALRNADRLDALVDGRPLLSLDLAAGPRAHAIRLELAKPGQVTLRSYYRGNLVAERRLAPVG